MFNKSKMFTDKTKLGGRARNIHNGFEGIANAKTSWMNGCIRISIKPTTLHDGKTIENEWFDIEEVEVVKENGKKEEPKATGGDQNDPTF